MTTLQIGRLGLDVTLDDPESAHWTTNNLQITFHLPADDVDHLTLLRDQLVGLVNNPDEPIVPVIADPDNGITGFWRVTDVTADVPASSFAYLLLDCTITLERIATSAAPLVESLLTQVLRTNAVGVTDPTYWHAIPAGADGYSLNVPSLQGIRSSESGDVTVFVGSILAYAWVAWTLEVADHYSGAATIEIGSVDDPIVTGATHDPPVEDYTPVVGKQLPNWTYGWRLNNGLIRVKPIYSADTPGLIVETWTGSEWSAPTLFELAVWNTGTNRLSTYMQSLRSVSVVKNSPEEVILKLGITNDTKQRGGLTIALRRGSLFLECYRTEINLADVDDHLAVVHYPVGSAASVTGGVHASAPDADGITWTIATSNPSLGDVTNGLVRNSSPTLTQDFMIGMSPGGSSPGLYNSPADLVGQFMACGGETTRIVGA